MSINFGDLFGKAKDAATAGMTDVLKQGGNAGLGWLEGVGIDILNADKAQHEAEFKNAVTNAVNAPSKPGSFSAYLSNVVQAPVIKEYGPYIILAVVIIGFGGMIMGRK